MPHIHDLIDLTVSAIIVYRDTVLLVHHKKLNKWLPPGGHVELDQDPEEALYAEIREETGLTPEDIIVHGRKPTIIAPGTKFLYSPTYLDIHDISHTHRHIGRVYFSTAKADRIQLAEHGHLDIRWFTNAELKDDNYAIIPSVLFYAGEALKTIAK